MRNLPASRSLSRRLLALALFASAVSTRAARAQLDETWSVKVNGQIVPVAESGDFVIANVAAVDNFSARGPGTAPDGLGDETVMLEGVSTAGGVTRYVFSEPFRIESRGTYRIRQVTLTDVAPAAVESLRIEGERLVPVGTVVALRVIGSLLGGHETDVSRAEQRTTYRSSNIEIAVVDADGLVTGRQRGTVFITATNGGATAVKRIDVQAGPEPVEIVGFVLADDGRPVAGALVTALGVTVVTGADGSFHISGLVGDDEAVVITVVATLEGETVTGSSTVLAAAGGLITDSGVITLRSRGAAPFFGTPQFDIKSEEDDTEEPIALAVTDVDGDRVTDVVVLTESILMVFKNRGQGALEAAEPVFLGSGVRDLALGDLDGDGRPDAIVSQRFVTGLVRVLINRGDGSFLDPVDIAVEDFPGLLVLADCDGDGALDVALSHDDFPARISILLGVRDGTFQFEDTVEVLEPPFSLAAGDVDGDRDVDLFVGYGSETRVSIALNDGSGRFPVRLDNPANLSPQQVALGDIDGDGDLDAVLSFPRDDRIAVVFNQGDGTPAGAPVILPSSPSPSDVHLADLDGDGDLDIAVNGDRALITTVRNLGDGRLDTPVAVPAVQDALALDVGDVDGDGFADLVTAGEDGVLGVVLNDGKGGFGAEQRKEFGDFVFSHAVDDFDADGDVDIVFLSGFPSALTTVINAGSGVFSDAQTRPLTGDLFLPELLSADLDGDGLRDLVGWSSSPSLHILRNAGGGAFEELDTRPFLNEALAAVALGDIDGDGAVDMTLAVRDLRNAIVLLINDGAGAFGETAPLALDFTPTALAAAALDDDAFVDVVAVGVDAASKGVLRVFRNRSGALEPDTLLEFGFTFGSIAALDFDGDGDIDLATTIQEGDDVALLINDGSGSFETGPTFEFGVAGRVAVGDIDLDGTLDLWIPDSGHESFGVFRQKDGGFVDPVRFGTGSRPVALVVTDLDGDGDPDVIVGHSQGASVHLHRRQRP